MLRTRLPRLARQAPRLPVFAGHFIENNGVPSAVTFLLPGVVFSGPRPQPHLFDGIDVEGRFRFDC